MPNPPRRPRPDPIHASIFADLPPIPHYDPSWHVARPRGEAGALAGGETEARAILPGVFRLRISDLDSSSSTSSSSRTATPPQPIQDEDDHHPASHNLAPREASAGATGAGASAWRRVLASRKAAGHILLPGRRAEVAEADVRLILQKDLDAELLPGRTSEVRAKVRVAESVLCTVVVVVEAAEEGGARLVVRRSFADCFRVANDVFDAFWRELGERLVLLRAV